MLIKPEDLLIGAHTSAAGGAPNALLEADAIGATTCQLFTSNQKRWEGREIPQEELDLWHQTLEMTGIQKVMSHDSYLINLGSPDPEGLRKSRKAFKEELIRCQKLGISFLNFHPGAALDGSEEKCLETIGDSLELLEDLASRAETRLLIETTAGQGTSVGWRFEHLGYLTDRLHKKIPIGVCIDTCHIFAAGYDIRTEKAWEETLRQFDEIVGIKHLYAFHVNDSMKPLGSRRDRHAPLGKGEIGITCFKTMMTHKLMRDIPKYLETPEGPPLWKEEIAMLRKFAKTHEKSH
ncbi:MAG: deoxyribonuclease IV [Chlamydiales bacterium]|nr:deoxyribonuclease IV [Chlamydiales bacterium]